MTARCSTVEHHRSFFFSYNRRQISHLGVTLSSLGAPILCLAPFNVLLILQSSVAKLDHHDSSKSKPTFILAANPHLNHCRRSDKKSSPKLPVRDFLKILFCFLLQFCQQNPQCVSVIYFVMHWSTEVQSERLYLNPADLLVQHPDLKAGENSV